MPTEEQIERLRRGIKLGSSRTAPAEIRLIERTKEGGNAWYEVTLHQGKNQQIRRMFDSIGHSVVKLRRARIGHITDRGLPVGQYRQLKASEVARFFQAEPRAALRRKGKAKTSAK
jgi:23S rRNA pseudouridine2605 synthase